MTEVVTIYRADTKGNSTLPERYSTDGLLSKQKDGGDPLFIKNYGWLKSIKSHIHYDNLIEKHLYDTTAFLSFTSSLEIAMNKYLPTKNNYRIEQTTFELADAFLFAFTFDIKQLSQIDEGIFSLEYKCNYEKFKNPYSIVDLFIKCNICSNNPSYNHKLLLINAATFLNKLVKVEPAVRNAFELSTEDNEWLIIPLDPMKDGIGFQSRIPVADFWTVKHYKHFQN